MMTKFTWQCVCDQWNSVGQLSCQRCTRYQSQAKRFSHDPLFNVKMPSVDDRNRKRPTTHPKGIRPFYGLSGGKSRLWEDRLLFWIAFAGFLTFLLLAGARSCMAKENVDWSGIVIHHSASPEWATLEDIDAWHKEKGWDGVGYHFVIEANGTIRQGRDFATIGAHALGRNVSHIGICLVGYDRFSEAQRQSLEDLLNLLLEEFDIQSIERHHEECPGTGIDVEGYLRASNRASP